MSPALTARLRKEKGRGRLRHVERAFRPGDLRGAFLVIAATDDEKVNEAVAARKDLLVNVVDRPEHCTFIVPSSVRRGPLHVAISTSGTSPAMARAIHKLLQRAPENRYQTAQELLDDLDGRQPAPAAPVAEAATPTSAGLTAKELRELLILAALVLTLALAVLLMVFVW